MSCFTIVLEPLGDSAIPLGHIKRYVPPGDVKSGSDIVVSVLKRSISTDILSKSSIIMSTRTGCRESVEIMNEKIKESGYVNPGLFPDTVDNAVLGRVAIGLNYHLACITVATLGVAEDITYAALWASTQSPVVLVWYEDARNLRGRFIRVHWVLFRGPFGPPKPVDPGEHLRGRSPVKWMATIRSLRHMRGNQL